MFSVPNAQGANPGTPVDAPYVVAISSTGTLTYTLPSQFNLTGINTYGEWRDSGRSNQDYTVAVSTDGTTFTALYTVAYDSQGGDNINTQVALTDTTGVLASNVKAVQFQFGTVEAGYVGYTEFALYGTSVPEPASVGLLTMVTLGLLARRHRPVR
jgi:hypothetical protein